MSLLVGLLGLVSYSVMRFCNAQTATQFPWQVSLSGNFIGVYVDSMDVISWEDAKQYCIDTFGSNLATITSDDENFEVRQAVIDAGLGGGKEFWIGYNDIENEGNFVWSDGNIDNTYQSWGNPPDNLLDQDCTVVWTNIPSGRTIPWWDDLQCEGRNGITRGFACGPEQRTDYPFALSQNGNFIGVYVDDIVNDVISWQDARDYCITVFGTDLATIRNDQENFEVRQAVLDAGVSGGKEFWIGYNDIQNEDEFVWSDGNIDNTYESWGNGQPDNLLGQDCAVVWTNIPASRILPYWDDLQCEGRNGITVGFACGTSGNAFGSTTTEQPTQEPTQQPRQF